MKILGMILAGGEGKRLYPLTKERAKSAVCFGGAYRIIDFVLSNFVNSELYKIKVLTQFMSESLNTHLIRSWWLSPLVDHYVEPVPAQMRTGKHWFLGSADAIYQNLNIITEEKPDHVCVFGGDHVYKMDVRQMLDFHIDHKSELTVAAVPIPITKASSFGVIQVNDQWEMIGFEEKPQHPKPIPNRPDMALVSMGNYIFQAKRLIEETTKDSQRNSEHDFGYSILTEVYKRSRVLVYDFSSNMVPGLSDRERAYWRDIGTIDSYFEANMDLISVNPVLNLYNEDWPIYTGYYAKNPPAKFVFNLTQENRVGFSTDSLISPGCIVSGGQVHRSILSPQVRINSYSLIEDSILFDHVEIGRHAKIRRTIIDKNVIVPPKEEIGYDLERDRKRFFVTDSGIVVIPKNTTIESK